MLSGVISKLEFFKQVSAIELKLVLMDGLEHLQLFTLRFGSFINDFSGSLNLDVSVDLNFTEAEIAEGLCKCAALGVSN